MKPATHSTAPPYRAIPPSARLLVLLALMLMLMLCTLLSSCAILGNNTPPPLRIYNLGALSVSPALAAPLHRSPPVNTPVNAPVLLVDAPHAAPGFESKRMVYTRRAQTQEVFANSAWAEPPARMLAPLLVAHLQQSGQFRAVLLAPSAAKASLRLDTTVLQLQQDFLQVPSRVQLRLQVTLLDNNTREVRAWRVVDVVRAAPSEDAAGGAQAANAAVQDALQQVTDFLRAELAVCCTR